MVAFNITLTPSAPDFKCSTQKDALMAVSFYDDDTTLTINLPVGVTGKVQGTDNSYERVFDVDIPNGSNFSFTLLFLRERWFKTGYITVEANTYPQDYRFTISANCVFVGLVVCNEGYADIYRKKSETLGVDTYTRDTATGSYYFDKDNGIMTTTNIGGITYSKVTATTTYQTSDDYFESYFDTINIVYEKDALQGNALDLFIKASTSLADCKVSWASDSNMQFQSDSKLFKLGITDQTGAWSNDKIRYARTKEIIIKDMRIKARNQSSIKLRVEGKLRGAGIDDINIHEINVLPNGIFFIGGDNA